MAITKTFHLQRPNTGVEFYTTAGRAAAAAGNASVLPQFQAMNNVFRNAGVTVQETLSGDGLTQTRVLTYPDLATLSAGDTAYTIAGAKEFKDYMVANGITLAGYDTVEARSTALTIAGIDAPYTVTTTYTFPSNTDPYIDTFVAGLETYDHYNKLTDLVINGADVICTHQYLNAADQSANPFLDMFFVPQLFEKNVTRTVVYAMV